MDLDEDGEDVVDSDMDLDLTLRTPARALRKSPRKQTRLPRLDIDDDMDGETAGGELSSPLRDSDTRRAPTSLLYVPSGTTRTNSNYTLSSFRNSWASSQSGSLTTLSRRSSLRIGTVLSKAPSTQSTAPSMSSRGSRSSCRASTSGASDSSSVAGVKRPLSSVSEGKSIWLGAGPVKRIRSESSSSRMSNTSVTTRKSAKSRARPAREGVNDVIAEASDTLESSEEESNIANPRPGLAEEPVSKRRRMGLTAAQPSSRLDRASSTLEQVPEGKVVPKQSTRRPKIIGKG